MNRCENIYLHRRITKSYPSGRYLVALTLCCRLWKEAIKDSWVCRIRATQVMIFVNLTPIAVQTLETYTLSNT